MQMPQKSNGEPDDSEVSQPKRVVCAVEADDTSVLRAAAEMTKQWDAKLYVVHVVPEVHEGLLATGFDSKQPLSEQNALQLLTEMKVNAGSIDKPVEAEVIVRTGEPLATIKRVARSLRADLVITRNWDRRRVQKTRKPGLHWDWILTLLGFDPVSAGW